jgi:hypothetical protein
MYVMNKKLIGIFIVTLLIIFILPISGFANISENEYEAIESLSTDWKQVYATTFVAGIDEWDTGALNGPDLWHITSFDSWSGDGCLACFHQDYKNYVNNMYFNYALYNTTINMQYIYAMVMDFYCKYITENINDNWGICIYDPIAGEFVPYTYSSLPYDTYGYHPEWMGAMQPMSEYQSFDIKAAYEYGYSLGLFRDAHGNQAYDLQVGFMFYESDGTGVTNDEAIANGEYWSGLLIDDVEVRQIVDNQDPLTPETPSGPTFLRAGVSYDFSTRTTDPNEDTVRFGWDWDGDDIVDEVTGFVNSGELVTTSHVWTTEGIYNIKVKAEDERGAMSDYSESLTVNVLTNPPPNTPAINGPTSGKAGTEYEYIFSTTDPDGDEVYYWILWFEGCPGISWDGPYTSGEELTKNYAWSEKGVYTIQVKTKDVYGAESDWATLEVSMPKNKPINTPFLRFLENHPHMFPLLRQLLRL